ncbi:hypothetical protein AX16_005607 [Volvariella volvacea WC 439]|nr:hypothetical protein AX16_005607 [Volvariella volvacea WC 439]
MKVLDKVLIASTLAVSAPVLVGACGDHAARDVPYVPRQYNRLNARQDPPAPPPPPGPGGPTSTQSGATPAPSGTGSTSGTASGTGSATASTPTVSISLNSVNPTAVPLSEIVSGATSSPTRPLDFTAVIGTTPTFIPGAPQLPDPGLLSPANYPQLDRPPPTDSPEVQQWIREVADSGVIIPDIPVNSPGGCAANPQAATDPARCWWTCGGCTRDTDITECPRPLEWGLTYDDGPAYHTSDLLNYLTQENLKSTFFVVGSRVISFPNILQSQYMQQHQIAVHTWSHPELTTLTNEQIIAELGWSKKVIKDVLGVTPNMMRPPYGDIDDRVRAISLAMGLVPVMWTRIGPYATFDTGDFNIFGGTTTVQQVLQNWQHIIGNATQRDTGFIVLEHDLYQQAVEVATGYILPDALAHNPPFVIQPVVSCLGRSMADAYIETNNNETNPPIVTQGVDNDGTLTLFPDVPGSVQTVAPGSGSSDNSDSGDSNSDNNGAFGAGPSIVSTFLGLLGGITFL